MKILIVEDDPLMSRMYQKTFVFEGYQVELAEDGQEGVNKAKSDKPNLILLDIMMPKMDGIKALEALKADESTKNIHVVMLTNLSESTRAEEALSKGAIRYIIKSENDPKQVIDLVKEVLG